jgi:hypothetical protein
MENEVEEAVEPHIDEIVEEAVVDQAVDSDESVQETAEKPKKTMVPLSALQKEREKKKELELELAYERRMNQQRAQQAAPQQEDDASRYESATREEVMASQAQTIRAVEERIWIRQNPEKYERVMGELSTFLKQRPNLARAIEESPNRYEEAYTLMDALTAKQQMQLKKDSVPQEKKKPAPNSPGGVPKAAALNDAVDLMSMSDSEFAAWRKSKQKARR